MQRIILRDLRWARQKLDLVAYLTAENLVWGVQKQIRDGLVMIMMMTFVDYIRNELAYQTVEA